MRHWYFSLSMDGVWSDKSQSDKYQCRIDTITFPDDGHMVARNMQRRGINKYIKENYAPSWIYLRDYTRMQVNKL